MAMSPCIARLLFNTEHTEKAQRATEFNDEPLERAPSSPAFSRRREKEPIHQFLGASRRRSRMSLSRPAGEGATYGMEP
jgi:hypothetical protein